MNEIGIYRLGVLFHVSKLVNKYLQIPFIYLFNNDVIVYLTFYSLTLTFSKTLCNITNRILSKQTLQKNHFYRDNFCPLQHPVSNTVANAG